MKTETIIVILFPCKLTKVQIEPAPDWPLVGRSSVIYPRLRFLVMLSMNVLEDFLPGKQMAAVHAVTGEMSKQEKQGRPCRKSPVT